MTSIATSLPAFTNAVNNGTAIGVRGGRWESKHWTNWPSKLWNRVTGQQESVEKAFFVALKETYQKDHLDDSWKSSVEAVQKKTRYHLETERLWQINRCAALFPSASMEKDALIEKAASWKQTQTQLPLKQRNLTESDLEKLEELWKESPNFASHLLEDAILRDDFYKWTIRDNLPSWCYLKPAASDCLRKTHLYKHISKFGQEMLQRKGDTVTLPFDGKAVNILDLSQEVTLDGHTTTVGKVMKTFQNKWKGMGDVVFLPKKGFTNWNGYKFAKLNSNGEYQYVDFTKNNWVKALPVEEILSSAQVKERYGVETEKDKRTLLVAVSTSDTPEKPLSAERVHAFAQIVKWIDNKWQVYSFGLYPESYPTTPTEFLTFFCNAEKGVISYPDENVIYSHRHFIYPKIVRCDQKQTAKLETHLAKLLQYVRKGKIVFQYQTSGCCSLVDNLFRSTMNGLTNLYRVPFLKTSPKGGLEYVRRFFKALPTPLQKPALKGFFTLFWPSRSRVGYNLTNDKEEAIRFKGSREWKTMEVEHPGAPFLTSKMRL